MTALNKQALREMAEKAIGAHERLSIMPSDDIFDISLHEGTQLDADITDLNAFNNDANPATVMALLDELEAAEKRIAELEAVREVFLRAKALMYLSGGAPIENSLNPIDAWLYDAERAAAGIGVKGV